MARRKDNDRQSLIIDDMYHGSREVRIYADYAPTLRSNAGGLEVMENNLDNVKIRKLTPRECSRLMGIGHKIGTFEFDDSDFQKMERINSNTQLYKQFGNSIVVDCLYYIFKGFFTE